MMEKTGFREFGAYFLMGWSSNRLFVSQRAYDECGDRFRRRGGPTKSRFVDLSIKPGFAGESNA